MTLFPPCFVGDSRIHTDLGLLRQETQPQRGSRIGPAALSALFGGHPILNKINQLYPINKLGQMSLKRND